MNINHIIAVFKAEYYTTTSKFRQYRAYIPIIFLVGVIAFSYILRVIYDFFRGDTLIQNPPITTFFSVIVIFSYFTLFAPLLSPIGRVVYDGSARSRRAVALNAPVESKDLLYGNLLSNLAFFLPFFGFVGTLTLAPFIGSGIFSPLITSLALFGILSMLILVGLVAGTLVSPLIFSFISARRNSQTRALVAFSVSAMMVFSLPIMRYFLENTTQEGNLGWVGYLPFTLAAILIVYVLYGVTIAVSPAIAITLLGVYITIVFVIGYTTADKLYQMEGAHKEIASANPEGVNERVLSVLTKPIPDSIANVVKSTMKASLRDIEHLSRLTIGLSITVFMIFALSSRGLFRDTANFDARIELAVVIFALVLSSASVIFIEASSFTIQHRDMFALIKSAPNGARKFVIGKAVQMVLLMIPIFVGIIFILTGFGFISAVNSGILSFIVILVLIMMTTLSLAIYLINPSDNEEDLGNFLNLLIFYVFSFIIAVIPVVIIIAEFTLTAWQLALLVLTILGISSGLLYTATEALERMNLETLDSTMTRSIIQGFKTVLLFVITWNILPLLGISYLLRTENLLGFNLIVYLIIAIIVGTYYFTQRKGLNLPELALDKFKLTLGAYALMILIGVISSVIHFFTNNTGSPVVDTLQFSVSNGMIFILVSLIVIVEELYFRGMLLEFSRWEMSILPAMILNAVLFGLLHIFTVVSLVNAIVLAMILCVIKDKTGSVLFPIIAHLLYNFTILISVLIM